jgi:hypothetical protein
MKSPDSISRDADAMATRAQELVARIAPLLHGQGSSVQGATLADLVAMWLAGHHPSIREQAMDNWLRTVGALIPLNEERIVGEGGWPDLTVQ